MRILISGGRNFQSYLTVCEVLDRIFITELAHGGAVGTDTLAGAYAKANDIPCTVYKANWDLHGKAAGMIRNKEMLKDFKPDLVILFPGGVGTENMKKLCFNNEQPMLVYNDKGQLYGWSLCAKVYGPVFN